MLKIKTHVKSSSENHKVSRLTFVESNRPILWIWWVKPYARPGRARVHLEAHLPHDLVPMSCANANEVHNGDPPSRNSPTSWVVTRPSFQSSAAYTVSSGPSSLQPSSLLELHRYLPPFPRHFSLSLRTWTRTLSFP